MGDIEQFIQDIKNVAPSGDSARIRMQLRTRANDLAVDAAVAEYLIGEHLNKPVRKTGSAPVVRRASEVEMKRTTWLWEKRIPTGSLTLLAGREGIGKSTAGYALAADITRGKLAGEMNGTPRNVLVVATEDSWAHTIVPRLKGAGADLDRILWLEKDKRQAIPDLSDAVDLKELEDAVQSEDVALVILDPIMSRLGRLDSHKDGEVRQALEPLTAIADRTGAAFLGLIHVNKSVGGDALTKVMGSRAFAAVARAVLYVMTDPHDDSIRLLGQAKSNLGPTPPTKCFTINNCVVGQDDAGEDITTGKVKWLEDTERSIGEALSEAEAPAAKRPRDSAVEFLREQLGSVEGGLTWADLNQAAEEQGLSKNTLYRASGKAGVIRLNGKWMIPHD